MLAIPQTPKLWQPRRGSWWRLPRLDALFMAHIKKSASTGHMLKTGTGHFAKGCGGYDWCTEIQDNTNSGFRIVLSGITVPSNACCWPGQDIGSFSGFDALDLTGISVDGTYDATTYGSFGFYVDVSLSIPILYALDCTTNTGSLSTLRVGVTCVSGTVYVEASMLGSVVGSGFFYGSDPSPSGASLSIPNDYASDGCGVAGSSNEHIGYGGTATVTALP